MKLVTTLESSGRITSSHHCGEIVCVCWGYTGIALRKRDGAKLLGFDLPEASCISCVALTNGSSAAFTGEIKSRGYLVLAGDIDGNIYGIDSRSRVSALHQLGERIIG